jgi:hypothetical protein
VYVTHTDPIKSFDYNRRTGEIFWTCPTKNMIGRHARADKDSLKLPNTTVWLSGVARYRIGTMWVLSYVFRD